MRSGVHVGEVELAGNRVRGLAVHEAARIAGAAAPDEVLVSRLTSELLSRAGFAFDSKGAHALKGVPGEQELFAVAEAPADG